MIHWEGKSLGGVTADNLFKSICFLYGVLCNRERFSVTLNMAPFFLAETVSKIQKSLTAQCSRYKPNIFLASACCTVLCDTLALLC